VKQTNITPSLRDLPGETFLRLSQIIGNKKHGITGILPVSKSAWYAGVAEGRYPAGVKLSERTTAWRVVDIIALVDRLKG